MARFSELSGLDAYAEIIPLLRLPRSLGIFDYRVPSELLSKLQPGTIVLIPFRGKKVQGVLLRLKKESVYEKLERIESSLTQESIIDEGLLRTYLELADECCVSPALFLRSVLPEIPKRIISKKIDTPFSPRGITVPSSFVTKIATGLSAATAATDVVLRLDDARVLYAIINRLALDAHRMHRHLRILAPRRTEATTIAHFLNQHGAPALRILPTDGASYLWDVWQKLRREELAVVVGTRAALFLPLPQRSTVVVLDEDSDDWKQGDINPRYDARLILPRLLSPGSHCVYVTQSVRPELAQRIASLEMRLTDIRVHQPPRTKLINMDDHFRSGNRAAISDTLKEALESARSALLFVYRKGRGHLLICQDCRFFFRCTDCDLPLSVHRIFLRCTACNTKIPMPATCSSCHGTRLLPVGGGTERIEEELAKLFPAARVIRVDSDTKTPLLLTPLNHKNQTIVVATQIILDTLGTASREIPPFDLIGVVDPDTALHRPDFRSQEKLARTITLLAHAAARLHAPLVIQTAFPNHVVWKIIEGGDDVYLENELQERKGLHCPPFSRMAKIIVQNKDQTVAREQAKTIYTTLLDALRSHKAVELVGPYGAVPPKTRGQYHELILIRFPPDLYLDVKPHLASLPDDVIVDLDTIDILR